MPQEEVGSSVCGSVAGVWKMTCPIDEVCPFLGVLAIALVADVTGNHPASAFICPLSSAPFWASDKEQIKAQIMLLSIVHENTVKPHDFIFIGRKVISTCWVLKIKHDSSYKARWVACGFSQHQGIDYLDTLCQSRDLQQCLFLPPPLSNKVIYFYIVFNGLALGERGP